MFIINLFQLKIPNLINPKVFRSAPSSLRLCSAVCICSDFRVFCTIIKRIQCQAAHSTHAYLSSTCIYTSDTHTLAHTHTCISRQSSVSGQLVNSHGLTVGPHQFAKFPYILQELFPRILETTPAGISRGQLLHFGQLINSGTKRTPIDGNQSLSLLPVCRQVSAVRLPFSTAQSPALWPAQSAVVSIEECAPQHATILRQPGCTRQP